MGRTAAAPAPGLTAVELLIYTSIIAVVTAFAVPMVSNAMHQTKLDEALEIAEQSVQKARRIARYYNTDVELRIESDGDLKQGAITLTVPKMQRDPTMNEVREEFALPAGVDIVSSDAIIHFDATGEVDWPATVMIVSQNTDDMKQHLLID